MKTALLMPLFLIAFQALGDFVDLACESPFRKINGLLVDLSPRFSWITNRIRVKPLPDWEIVGGTVAQIMGAEGILVDTKSEMSNPGIQGQVRIKNYRFQKSLVDGDPVICFALKERDPFQFNNTRGGTSTIYSFDYGEQPTRDEKLSASEQTRLQREAAIRKFREDQEAMARMRASKTASKNLEIQKKLLQFQMQQASNGLPSFQYDLGVRYLNGNGVDKDPGLARRWLKAAADQGNIEAATKLQDVKSPAP